MNYSHVRDLWLSREFIADFLIPRFLDETRLAGRAYDDDSPAKTMGNKAPIISSVIKRSWPSQSARHFLRELIVNSFLLPILDIIANPDTINHLIILALDNHRGDDSHLARVSCFNYLMSLINYLYYLKKLRLQSYYVPFLKGLTDLTVENVPDSLLQLKLSEVLRDARQFSMFRLYLKDTRGPVNELNFLAEATRIHESMQKKAESSGQIAYDIWQLFGQFVHESAPDRIGFTSEIVEEYRLAVESNNLEELDRVIEKVTHIIAKSFQVIYQRMQLEYVVPFCQSDSFLGYLCGSPPISVNELIDKPCVQRKSSIAERSFSLAQFRSRLRRAIASTSFDGFLDGDTDEGLIYSSDTAEVRNDRRQYFGSSIEKKECEKNVYDEIMPPTPSHSRSLPHLDLPIIDISASENDSYNISPASVISNADEDALNSCGALVEQPQSEPILIIDHDIKDMNQWRVTIPKITPTRDITTGRTIYSYVIEVERSEAKEHETKKWSIYRRFAEFYVLEAKLVEFHGDSLRFPSLPPRKAFVTKNRAFMEQHRLVFASFISSLSKQVVKKMPGKLSREKGQNLRPFLLNLLAKTLSPQEKVEFKENVEVSSDSRFDMHYLLNI
uniref:PX domain-containing protein n=1 Tax=Heterorhabditis bacteriophora TaxID=37862 RepID=A0A1I7XQB7_HETBA